MHDRLCLFRMGTSEVKFPQRSADPAVADGDDPVAEQVAADRGFVSAVMVPLVAVGFERDGQEVEHAPSACSGSRRYW